MTERSVKVTQTQNPNREMPDKIVYWVPHGSILHLRKTVGAAMPRPGRGHSRPYAERGARQLNVTLADALRPAVDTCSQVAAGIGAGQLLAGDRRGPVGEGDALRPLLGGHSRFTPDRFGLPAPGSRAEGGLGTRLRVLHNSGLWRAASGRQVRPPARRAGGRPRG